MSERYGYGTYEDMEHPAYERYIEESLKERAQLENERRRTGRPTPALAMLLSEDNHPVEFTQRDATVAATIMQWLGSNVGRSLVDAALREDKLARECAQ